MRERKQKSGEEARLEEMREVFRQMNEIEQGRADRNAEALKDRREEDEKNREKRERLKERLDGLGMYKESSDLGVVY